MYFCEHIIAYTLHVATCKRHAYTHFTYRNVVRASNFACTPTMRSIHIKRYLYTGTQIIDIAQYISTGMVMGCNSGQNKHMNSLVDLTVTTLGSTWEVLALALTLTLYLEKSQTR